MAERKRSTDDSKDTEQVVTDQKSGSGAPVPGAHGDEEDFHNGVTGVSRVRSEPDEIEPSEDVGNGDA